MSKFKPGERARILKYGSGNANPALEYLTGKQCVINGVADVSGHVDKWGFAPVSGEIFYDVSVDGGLDLYVAECSLQKLLPDSDTYRPADISLDDLLSSLRERETV